MLGHLLFEIHDDQRRTSIIQTGIKKKRLFRAAFRPARDLCWHRAKRVNDLGLLPQIISLAPAGRSGDDLLSGTGVGAGAAGVEGARGVVVHQAVLAAGDHLGPLGGVVGGMVHGRSPCAFEARCVDECLC
jgi:hypothetical protein